jgi:hypothetical protein
MSPENWDKLKENFLTFFFTTITVGGGGFFWYENIRIPPFKEENGRLKTNVENLEKDNEKLKEDRKLLCKKLEGEFGSRITRKVSFDLTPSRGILYIFKDPSGPNKAGLPQDAQIYIINGNNQYPLNLKQTVDLGENIQAIESLKITVSYKYYADSSYAAASLSFIIKDPQSNQTIATLPANFIPRSRKQTEATTVSLPVSQQYQGKQLTIETKPTSSGDFGFFISSIKGEIMTTQIRPTTCDSIIEK